MINSEEFLRAVLDSLPEQIAVIDKDGMIVFVNQSWHGFGEENSCATVRNWSSANYLLECQKAAEMGDMFGEHALKGIRSVINKTEKAFYFEYPCHSDVEERWFMMRVVPLTEDYEEYFIISHHNITERKLAENEVLQQARIDGLTNIPNRRAFDEFLKNEWKRCARLQKNITLALIDLDHFKRLNDTYGHQAGDECLVQIGNVLKKFAKRPNDFCARYGGEEFVVVWGGADLLSARNLANKLLSDIVNLNIPNKNSGLNGRLTASIGLAFMIPSRGSEESDIIRKADELLYTAKKKGRFRIES